MPRGDRTGPMGMGPMTGRSLGYCAEFPTSGYARPMSGRGCAWGRGSRDLRGMGKGYGSGMGFRWMRVGSFGAQIFSQEEATLLKSQASLMQKEMNAINARIKELEGPEK